MHIEWKNVEKRNSLPSNEPWMFIDVSERINPFPTHNTNLLGMLYFNDRWIEALQGGQKCKITFVNLHKVFENRLFLFVHFQGLIFRPGWTIMRAIEKDKGVLPG